MTRTRRRILIAAAAVTLVELLALALAILRPEGLAVWLMAAATAPALWLVGESVARRKPGTADHVRASVAAAAALLALPLAAFVADAVGLVENPDGALGQRAFGVIMGLIIAAYGNIAPKQLMPYDPDASDAACKPSFVRYSGWIFALAGLGYALIWIFAPVGNAILWASLLVAAGLPLVGLRIVRGRAGGRRPVH